jgi:hypothetical protein
MAKETILVDGKEMVVREDTAKSYRGVIWFLSTLAMIVIITAVLLLGGFIGAVSDGELNTPKTKTGEAINN